MLRLPRDQLRIGITPHAVVLARVSRGRPPSVIEKHIEKCQPGSTTTHSILTTLTQQIAHEKWQNTVVSVTLSNHLVNYLLIPYRPDISSDNEHDAFIQHRFNKVFGAQTKQWTLCKNEVNPGVPTLVGGVALALLEGIRQICHAHKLPLRTVQPYLAQAFNQHCHLFKHETSWFMLIEHERVTLAQFQHNAWQHINTHLIDNDSLASSLMLLLERQLCLSDLHHRPAKVFLLAPEHPKLALADTGAWIIQQIQPEARFGLSPQKHQLFNIIMGEN